MNVAREPYCVHLCSDRFSTTTIVFIIVSLELNVGTDFRIISYSMLFLLIWAVRL
jgi:hypothetical protein